MYNRYIPQPDGSYRKNAMPESRQNVQRQASQRPVPPTPPPPPPVQQRPPRQDSIPSFLRQLIPQCFDTGDLIVVLLLLLMAGDCQENQNTALLTLVLYLFL